jgi:hypothetical protein
MKGDLAIGLVTPPTIKTQIRSFLKNKFPPQPQILLMKIPSQIKEMAT